jgi:hypothetical protein
VYEIIVEHHDDTLEMDAEVNKFLRKKSVASGFGMGIRDLVYEFKTEKAALRAKARIEEELDLRVSPVREI